MSLISRIFGYNTKRIIIRDGRRVKDVSNRNAWGSNKHRGASISLLDPDGDWVSDLRYLRGLQDIPSQKQLEKTALLMQHPHWIVRMNAIETLCRANYLVGGLDDILSGLNDDHYSIKDILNKWLVRPEREYIKYKCRRNKSDFGGSWSYKTKNARAIVADIDDDINDEPLVGLSAMQITNLDLKVEHEGLDEQHLSVLVTLNKQGSVDPRDMGKVVVYHNDKFIISQVYNAFGINSIGGNGVRVSNRISRDIGVNIGGEITIKPLIYHEPKMN